MSKIFPYGSSAIPEVSEAESQLSSQSEESVTKWRQLNQGAYVISDSTRDHVANALLDACDASQRYWTPELPVCLD